MTPPVRMLIMYLRFSYDSRTSTFIIRRPVAVHEAFKSRVDCWIQNKLDAIADTDPRSELFVKNIYACRSATILIDPPGNERVVICHTPDSQFRYKGTGWPSVVIEVAQSPGPKSLSRLAEDYIVQSRGKIGTFVGFELGVETKKVSVTVWRAHVLVHPEKGPIVAMKSETHVSASIEEVWHRRTHGSKQLFHWRI